MLLYLLPDGRGVNILLLGYHIDTKILYPFSIIRNTQSIEKVYLLWISIQVYLPMWLQSITWQLWTSPPRSAAGVMNLEQRFLMNFVMQTNKVNPIFPQFGWITLELTELQTFQVTFTVCAALKPVSNVNHKVLSVKSRYLQNMTWAQTCINYVIIQPIIYLTLA